MIKKIRRYLANKLYPYADISKVDTELKVFETSKFDIETLCCERFIHDEFDIIPGNVYKQDIAKELGKELEPYINYEVREDPYLNVMLYRGTIRIVKKNKKKNDEVNF